MILTHNLFSEKLNEILLLSNLNTIAVTNRITWDFFPYKPHKYCGCHHCLTFVCHLQTLFGSRCFSAIHIKEQIPHKIHFKTSIPCICWRGIVVLLLGDYSLLAIDMIKVYSYCKHHSIKLSRQNIQIYLIVVKSGGYCRRDGVPGTANGYVSHMRKSVFLVTDT